MKAFPTERTEKRRVLMEAVEAVRATLEAGTQEAEETATLPLKSVEALYESGLLRLKLPHVLGGAEADPMTQLDVLEAVSRIDPSAGWCLMIGAASLGSLAAFLPDDAVDEIFVDGMPPRVAGAFAPFGTAVPVAGGYRVTGAMAVRQRSAAFSVGFGRRPGDNGISGLSAPTALRDAHRQRKDSRQLGRDGPARHREL